MEESETGPSQLASPIKRPMHRRVKGKIGERPKKTVQMRPKIAQGRKSRFLRMPQTGYFTVIFAPFQRYPTSSPCKRHSFGSFISRRQIRLQEGVRQSEQIRCCDCIARLIPRRTVHRMVRVEGSLPAVSGIISKYHIPFFQKSESLFVEVSCHIRDEPITYVLATGYSENGFGCWIATILAIEKAVGRGVNSQFGEV